VLLVHLAWGPLGLDRLRAFLRVEAAFDPGVERELLVVLNGFEDEHRADARALARDAGAAAWSTPAPCQDLDAYRVAAAAHPAGSYVFVNSYARPLAEGWVAKLVDAAGPQGVAGATGSFETQRLPYVPARGGHSLGSWLRDTAHRAGPATRSRLQFPAFPNPHLRTNAFAMRASTLADLRWSSTPSKREALVLEGGRRGLSAQAGRRVLVDRDGRAVPPEAWPTSRIFRSGEQERLLVADNRTDQYAEADAAEREALRRLAWGDAALT
jgi:hypothetical protein